MAFSDLQLKVATEKSIQAAHKNLAPISLFSTSFSELEGKFGEAVAVPYYNLSASSEFDASTNNYVTNAETPDGCLVNLDKHYVKSVKITDRQLAETGVNWIGQSTEAITDTLTRAMNKAVFGQLSACELTADVTLTTKAAVANLYAVAEANDIPVDRAVVVLTPSNYATVLGLVGDASIYGGTEAIRGGVIPGMFGFKAVLCTSNLPASLSADGAIIADSAIGVAGRYLESGTPDMYQDMFRVDTEDGLPIGFRRFARVEDGSNYLAGEILFGTKVIQADKIVILK